MEATLDNGMVVRDLLWPRLTSRARGTLHRVSEVSQNA